MPEQDLLQGLAALAEHAGRTGRLDAATAVRARADRRRRRRYVASAALGVVLTAVFGVGIALGQPKQSPEPPTILPSPTVAPTVVPSPSRVYRPGEPIKAPPPGYPPMDGPTVAPTTTDPPPPPALPTAPDHDPAPPPALPTQTVTGQDPADR
jgi:hypothetical protein